MTTEQLFSLPVGERVDEWMSDTFGTVVGRSPTRVIVHWDDGSAWTLSRDHDQIGEFAGYLQTLTYGP